MVYKGFFPRFYQNKGQAAAQQREETIQGEEDGNAQEQNYGFFFLRSQHIGLI